jgi:hypothetical protein
VILFLIRSIAIGQKTQRSSSAFGEGHNINVHAGFRVQTGAEESALNAALDKVLKAIDHRALGVDVDLGMDPELSNLAPWLLEKLHAEGAASACEIKLVRGDGLTVRATLRSR